MDLQTEADDSQVQDAESNDNISVLLSLDYSSDGKDGQNT